MTFASLFQNFTKKYKQNNSVTIFNVLKQKIIEKYNEIFPKNNLGRPNKYDLNIILDCIFSVAEDGIKTRNIKKYYGIPKTTYLRYFNNFKNSKIFELINSDMLKEKNVSNNKQCISDVEIIKSVNGSEGVGANCTDRGRNGIKESIIIDYETKAIIETFVDPANVHDSKILQKMNFINNLHNKIKVIYVDSAYVGKPMREYCRKNNIRVVAVQKKNRNNKVSHYLQTKDRKKLSQRWSIERIISIYRQFRGICIKRTKYINSFQCLFNLASMCITCLSLFIN